MNALSHTAFAQIILTSLFVFTRQNLNKQLGIVDFAPFKEQFLAAQSRAAAMIMTLPSLTSLPLYMHRNWKDATPKNCLPAIGLQLSTLANRLQVCIKCVLCCGCGCVLDLCAVYCCVC